MRSGQFHLSVGVKSLAASKAFYSDVLGAEITHDGDYVNLDLYGGQITLKENVDRNPELPHLHFGVNLPLVTFTDLAERIAQGHAQWVHTPLHIVDEGTEMERQKINLKCPSGYLIELKGYRHMD